MSANLLEKNLLTLAAALENQAVPFCVVGGFAVTFRAEPRLTRDIDGDPRPRQILIQSKIPG